MTTATSTYLPHLPAEEYHAGPGLSRSDLKQFLVSPLHFRHRKPAEPTTPLIEGSAFHTLALEPHLFDDQYYWEPEGDRRTKAVKEAVAEAAAENPGKFGLRGEHREDMVNWVRALRNDPVASEISKEVLAVEQSFFAEDPETGALCKARPDAIVRWQGKVWIVDLKTAISAEPHAFYSQGWKTGLQLQAAHYDWVVRHCADAPDWARQVFGFLFLVVEKKPLADGVHAVVPYINSDDEFRAKGQQLVRFALDGIAECEQTGRWPAYGNGEILPMRPPSWAGNETDDWQ